MILPEDVHPLQMKYTLKKLMSALILAVAHGVLLDLVGWNPIRASSKVATILLAPFALGNALILGISFCLATISIPV